jgi:glutathione synthase/RimK-type ligase-like ATP-grasp enzyme
VLLRWGSRLPVPCDLEINPASAIARASNKFRTFSILSSNNIPVPVFGRTFEEVWALCPNAAILGRKDNSSGGRGIEIIRRGSQPEHEHDFYAQFIRSSREFRVHVVDGTVIRVQGKYHDHPGHPLAGYIKNHATGYRFRTPRNKLRQSRLDDAIESVRLLGLDFGAVDMILTDDGNHHILEVNTGPACSPLTALQYVTALCELITERTDGGIEMVPRLGVFGNMQDEEAEYPMNILVGR